jgi:hypothetical protein
MGKLRPRRYYLDDYEDAYVLIGADSGSKIITLPGPFEQGRKGSSRECSISNFIMDHPELFPHKVLGAQTIRSRVDVVDRVKKGGVPAHCRVYAHFGWRKVDGNDDEELTENDANTPLILRPLLPRNNNSRPQTSGKSTTHSKLCLRGTLARAVRAKFMTEAEARRRRRAAAKAK